MMGQEEGMGLRHDGKAYQPTSEQARQGSDKIWVTNTTQSKRSCLVGVCTAALNSSRIKWGP